MKNKVAKILSVYLMALVFAGITAYAASVNKAKVEPAKGEKKMSEVYAIFDTSMGKMKAKLFADKVPNTVKNFTDLAEGKKPITSSEAMSRKDKPFYNGIIFHRVMPDFMIQAGCPLGQGTGGSGKTIKDEIVPELKHDRKCLLSMANRGPDTGDSQFFITVAPTSWLDGKHAIFGEVIEGCDVAIKISTVPANSTRPIKDVVINSVTIERK